MHRSDRVKHMQTKAVASEKGGGGGGGGGGREGNCPPLLKGGGREGNCPPLLKGGGGGPLLHQRCYSVSMHTILFLLKTKRNLPFPQNGEAYSTPLAGWAGPPRRVPLSRTLPMMTIKVCPPL